MRSGRFFLRWLKFPVMVYNYARTHDLSLHGLAQATGVSDQTHFSNTFKLYTGATPSQYALLP